MLKSKMLAVLIIFIAFSSVLVFTNRVSAAEAKTESPQYLIGPNDVLYIFVWREPDLTMEVTVMSDGRISFPLIGDIMAQGQTVDRLRYVITKELKKYIDAPTVTVIVKENRSRIIYTIGNVRNPGPKQLMANMTVLQALSSAAGFSEWADTKNVLIIRRMGEKEVQFQFNYKDFIAGKNAEQNIALMPNDTIVVP